MTCMDSNALSPTVQMVRSASLAVGDQEPHSDLNC